MIMPGPHPHRNPEFDKEITALENKVRLFRICLVLLSNLFFIEWAYDDYQKLRKRNRRLSCWQLLLRMFCFCCYKPKH